MKYVVSLLVPVTVFTANPKDAKVQAQDYLRKGMTDDLLRYMPVDASPAPDLYEARGPELKFRGSEDAEFRHQTTFDAYFEAIVFANSKEEALAFGPTAARTGQNIAPKPTHYVDKDGYQRSLMNFSEALKCMVGRLKERFGENLERYRGPHNEKLADNKLAKYKIALSTVSEFIAEHGQDIADLPVPVEYVAWPENEDIGDDPTNLAGALKMCLTIYPNLVPAEELLCDRLLYEQSDCYDESKIHEFASDEEIEKSRPHSQAGEIAMAFLNMHGENIDLSMDAKSSFAI